MDDRHFDAFSKTLANRRSRRSALKAGGAGAALFGLLGISSARAALAQDDDVGGNQQQTGLDDQGICHLQFEANVRFGPSADSDQLSQVTGILSLGIGDNGGIGDGVLTLEDGTEYPVVGQASGRSLSMRIRIGDETLVAVGVGEENVRACSGEYGGPTTGPARGDLGDWIAFGGSANGSGNDGSGGSSQSSGSSGGSNSGSSPTATATAPPDCDVECTDPYIIEAETCDCICPGGLLACGPVCCPINSVCTDESAGECSCPPGSELCIDTCVSCPSGQMVDDNCQCVDAPCPPGQDLCNGMCVDIVNSTSNCGSCGNACGTGVPCIAGVCKCPPGYDVCADGCKDLASDEANCGTCGNACGTGMTCSGGTCA